MCKLQPVMQSMSALPLWITLRFSLILLFVMTRRQKTYSEDEDNY